MKLVDKIVSDNIAEIWETRRKLERIAVVIGKHRTLLTVALMVAACALPAFAQLTPSTNPFPGQGDQTITSWGDSITNFFLWALPVGAIVCVGMLIVNVIRKQPWSNYGIGAFLCLGGWGFVGWLAFKAANGQTIRPTSSLGH